MKMILPVEYQIQQKAEQYQDDSLQKIALEVRELKRDKEQNDAHMEKQIILLRIGAAIVMGAVLVQVIFHIFSH